MTEEGGWGCVRFFSGWTWRQEEMYRITGGSELCGMMTEEALLQLKYPIGRFVRGTEATTPQRREACIAVIEALPALLRAAVEDLGDARSDTPYRPGGWTVRQVVHHLADSHGQGEPRFRLALTEDGPTIKAYKEAAWAELVDARTMPVEASLMILQGLHARWAMLMRNLTPEELSRSFVHPGQGRSLTLAEAMEMYAWHSRHHLAHITRLREREGW